MARKARVTIEILAPPTHGERIRLQLNDITPFLLEEAANARLGVNYFDASSIDLQTLALKLTEAFYIDYENPGSVNPYNVTVSFATNAFVIIECNDYNYNKWTIIEQPGWADINVLTEEPPVVFSISDVLLSQADSNANANVKYTIQVANGLAPYTINNPVSKSAPTEADLFFDYQRNPSSQAYVAILDSNIQADSAPLPRPDAWTINSVSVAQATFTTANITINASKSITGEYPTTVTYSINGSAYQASNIFLGVGVGNYTAYVKDSLGGILVSSFEVVDTTPPPILTEFTRSLDYTGNGIIIYRDGKWWPLRLKEEEGIRYNAVINRIGRLDVREISHSNTFSILPISQNITALGLNFFNPSSLATTLNGKFPAKYFVDNRLLLEGYVVVNNTNDGLINLNFIDEALDITDKWGSTSFKSLLTSMSITRPSDYQIAIDEMVNYTMSQSSIIPSLSQVGTRGHNLAYFPNNLNAIGDKFQLNDLGERVDDGFNPYQSRPIFNVKALFDLACESFGHTPIYTASINLKEMENEAIVANGLGEGTLVDDTLIQKDYGVVEVIDASRVLEAGTYDFFSFVLTYGNGVDAVRPIDITGFESPPFFYESGDTNIDYRYKSCIHRVDSNSPTVGVINYYASIEYGLTSDPNARVRYAYAMWEDTSLSPGNWLFQELVFLNDNSTQDTIDVDIDKAQLATAKPANAGYIVGIMFQESGSGGFFSPRLLNSRVREEVAPVTDIVTFDNFNQYFSESVNLTYAAPEQSIKTLLSSYMQKAGILMNIDSKNKEIKFFTYNHYTTEKIAGNYYDWSKYLRKYNLPTYNTDYGGKYYKKNTIGLTDSFKGNVYYVTLDNQGFESKLKDAGDNLVKNFKDVEGIISVNNSIVPYFEYTNKGLGLVALGNALTGLTQERVAGVSQGALNPLQSVLNVNYTKPPQGVKEWYNLVDTAIKVEAKFLLPVKVVKELDLSKPVYIEDLGGFFIIEEVAEYVNAQTPVNVKLIKLTISYPIITYTYDFEDSINFEFEDSEDYFFEDQ